MTSNLTASTVRETSRNRTCRVLIVEDDADSSHMLAVALQIEGHSVETTRNGTEALTVAGSFSPHVVLIDIGLPGLDGLFVTRELRKSQRQVLIIAVTGRSSPDDVRRSHDAGCDHHFVKPVDIRMLTDFLRQWEGRDGCRD